VLDFACPDGTAPYTLAGHRVGRLGGRATGRPASGQPVDSIETEVRRQNKRNQAIALGPEVIAQLDRACSGPLHQWVDNLRILNISCGDPIPLAERYPFLNKDNGRIRTCALANTSAF
jgi:hypothetical protein